MRVEKKGTVHHVIVTKTSGHRSYYWCVKDVEILKPEGGRSFVRLTPDNPFLIDFSKTDFDELPWVGMDNFKGVKDTPAKVKVFVFDVKNVGRSQKAQEVAANGNVIAPPDSSQGTGGKNNDRDLGDENPNTRFRIAQFGDTVSYAELDVLSQMPVDYDDGVVGRV